VLRLPVGESLTEFAIVVADQETPGRFLLIHQYGKYVCQDEPSHPIASLN
jgi:hypothetical protein